jgi:hypothetical protein
VRFATLLIALVLVAGCGEDDEQAAAPTSEPSGSLAELTVEVDPDGEGAKPPREATISCNAPEESAVCRAVADVKPETFEPTPGNVACTQQYGGPETASVKGTLRGEPVDATFSRVNGCEISRWQDAAAILEAAG